MGRATTPNPLSEAEESDRSLNLVQSRHADIVATAAGTGISHEILRDGRGMFAAEGETDTGGTCYGIALVFDAALTGANTNYSTVSVHRWNGGVDAGAVTTPIAYQLGTNAAAQTPVPLQFSGTGQGVLDANGGLPINVGDSLVLVWTETGTGIAKPAHRVSLRYAPESTV